VVILVESTISIKHTQQFCDPPINDISSATVFGIRHTTIKNL
jgi:hypothetical protein